MFRGAILFLILVFCASMPSRAISKERCGDFLELLKSMSDKGDFFDSFTFQTSGEGKNTLILSKHSASGKVQYWSLINRVGDVSNFCIIGEGPGSGFGLLMSAPTNNFEDRFGLPGSGNPRCATYDDPFGSVKVRMWANRELGDSTIIFTESAKSSSFVYLMSKEGSWIIIETTKGSENSTCYFARGENVIFRPNALWNKE